MDSEAKRRESLDHLRGMSVAEYGDISLGQAVDEAGFVLVPIEPSMDMGLAGAEAVNKQMRGPGAPADFHAAIDAYKAMIAEASDVPVDEEEWRVQATAQFNGGKAVGRVEERRRCAEIVRGMKPFTAYPLRNQVPDAVSLAIEAAAKAIEAAEGEPV